MYERLNACPLCDGRDGSYEYLSCKDELVTGEMFHVEQCVSCGFLYTNPRPNALNISAYYRSDDYISHHDTPHSIMDKVYHRVRSFMMGKKAKLIRNFVSDHTSILDVGCGTGAFLKRMAREGYRVTGVEPGEPARKMAQSKGLHVVKDLDALDAMKPKDGCQHPDIHIDRSDRVDNVTSTAYKAEQAAGSLFSCISLWHVMEHMHDFKEQCNQYYRLLNTDGCLVVAVPMVESFDAAYYQQHWAAYDLPRHLYHFNEKSLITAVEMAGFALKKTQSLPFDSFYVSILSEKYRNSLPAFFAYLRALVVGLVSNMVAASGRRPASSQVFVFRKTAR